MKVKLSFQTATEIICQCIKPESYSLIPSWYWQFITHHALFYPNFILFPGNLKFSEPFLTHGLVRHECSTLPSGSQIFLMQIYFKPACQIQYTITWHSNLPGDLTSSHSLLPAEKWSDHAKEITLIIFSTLKKRSFLSIPTCFKLYEPHYCNFSFNLSNCRYLQCNYRVKIHRKLGWFQTVGFRTAVLEVCLIDLISYKRNIYIVLDKRFRVADS